MKIIVDGHEYEYDKEKSMMDFFRKQEQAMWEYWRKLRVIIDKSKKK